MLPLRTLLTPFCQTFLSTNTTSRRYADRGRSELSSAGTAFFGRSTNSSIAVATPSVPPYFLRRRLSLGVCPPKSGVSAPDSGEGGMDSRRSLQVTTDDRIVGYSGGKRVCFTFADHSAQRNLYRISATCARVAGALGARRSFPTPLRSPSATAQRIASRAYTLTVLPSA